MKLATQFRLVPKVLCLIVYSSFAITEEAQANSIWGTNEMKVSLQFSVLPFSTQNLACNIQTSTFTVMSDCSSFVTLRRVLENQALRGIVGTKRQDVTESWSLLCYIMRITIICTLHQITVHNGQSLLLYSQTGLV